MHDWLWLNAYAAKVDGKLIFSKVAGVSHLNANRTSRQKIIREELRAMGRLLLRREPDNKFDPNAVVVLSEAHDQIGYLQERLAGEVAESLRGGCVWECWVSEVTSGGARKKAYGVNIVLLRYARHVG